MTRIIENFRAGKAVFVLAVAALLLSACYGGVSPVTNSYSYDDGYTYRYGYGYGYRYGYPYRFGHYRSYYGHSRGYRY